MLKKNNHRNATNATNYIFASLLVGVYDVNRNELLEKNDFSIIQKWYNSILKLQINAIIFHNSFSNEIVEKYTNEYIQFIEIDYDKKLNPNVYRYFIYSNFLKQNSGKIKNLFVTDIADVEVTINPFESNLFLENSHLLFCGDEPEILGNMWMQNHSSHLRKSIPEFTHYEVLNEQQVLLNCGIIGANINVMQLLFNAMVEIHEAYSYSNSTNYTLDMGVFNFVARTIFAGRLYHGEPVNTVFKKYESQRNDCWFRHK